MTPDASRAHLAIDDLTERCIACDEPMRAGEPYYLDVSGGDIHARCCGPERESYTNAEGEPLGPGEPIPTPAIWGAQTPLTVADRAYAEAMAAHSALFPSRPTTILGWLALPFLCWFWVATMPHSEDELTKLGGIT